MRQSELRPGPDSMSVEPGWTGGPAALHPRNPVSVAAIVSPEVRPTPRGEILERFLAGLSDRWWQDESASSQPRKVRAPRTWRTLSKGRGAKYSSGCRKTRTPARWHCWAGCSQLIRAGSVVFTCALCSGECGNGGVSWRVNWFTPYPAKLHGTNIHCRN